jgi:hypothetical protein
MGASEIINNQSVVFTADDKQRTVLKIPLERCKVTRRVLVVLFNTTMSRLEWVFKDFLRFWLILLRAAFDLLHINKKEHNPQKNQQKPQDGPPRIQT